MSNRIDESKPVFRVVLGEPITAQFTKLDAGYIFGTEDGRLEPLRSVEEVEGVVASLINALSDEIRILAPSLKKLESLKIFVALDTENEEQEEIPIVKEEIDEILDLIAKLKPGIIAHRDTIIDRFIKPSFYTMFNRRKNEMRHDLSNNPKDPAYHHDKSQNNKLGAGRPTAVGEVEL